MAVKIRLRRMGKKKSPHYRIIVADERAARDGRFLDLLGFYSPAKEPNVVELNKEKAMDWLKKGAQVSPTVKSIMKKKGLDVDEFKKILKKK